MVSDERALAVRLASTDDDALARTFAERGVAPGAGWHDFFDAAAGMLDPASVERAVARLPRTALVALAAALEGAPIPDAELSVLRELALADDDGAPFGAVAARVRAASTARPDAFEPEPPAPAVAPAQNTEPPPRLSARSRRSALWPTSCSRACTPLCRAPARARSARSIADG